MTVDVYLVRHGETENNQLGVLAGRSDVRITEKGIEQIRNMVKHHPFPQPSLVYVSPLERCRETARLVFPRYMEQNLPRIEENLIEMDFGEYEGIPVRSFADTGLYKGWREQNPDTGLPGGETFGQVERRAAEAIDRILADCEREGIRDVGVVSHNMVIVGLLREHMTVKLDERDRFCPNGMGFHLQIEADLWKREKRMHFIGPLPAGAPRPDPSESPYVTINK